MMRRALLSVSDKTGILEMAQALAGAGIELVSTGGTARTLREAGLEVKDISEITGFPEMMDGRLKTLHPIVHGGMLFLRGNVEHESQAREHRIEPIDFVIVNLYPFESTTADPDCRFERAIENIDIGGPTMLRSAAKNHSAVTVVVDPADYDEVAGQLGAHGQTTSELRARLAAKVFRTTSHYDTLIADYLEAHAPATDETKGEPPVLFSMAGRRVQTLRYGENPHQSAALYGNFHQHFEQLHGKDLSYNNIVDINAAVGLIGEFRGEKPTVAILKHTNPCGLASADTNAEAWNAAYDTDKQAPFGGIITCNKPLDLPLAELIREIFSEVIIAPAFDSDALALLQQKKNLRLILNKQFDTPVPPRSGFEVRSILGASFLVQQPDSDPFDESDWKIVTRRPPTEEEMAGMRFAWKVCKHVKSNAIVYAKGTSTLGIGAGQMARVDSSRIAVWKAKEAGLDLAGSVMASEALLPFADGLEAAAEAGATAVIQTGGAKRDEEVIAAADEANMAMIFTGRRHFKH